MHMLMKSTKGTADSVGWKLCKVLEWGEYDKNSTSSMDEFLKEQLK